MDDEALLSTLQRLEDDSSDYTWGKLGEQREQAMREYFRMPYGTEEEGWSHIVTSEVQDTIEWILPDMLEIFTGTDKAVSFDPQRAEDVKPSEQATDTCNYVFYKQNNGFLLLYTAFKDAMLAKNCAVHWRKEKVRVPRKQMLRGVTDLHIALAQTKGWEIDEAEAAVPTLDPESGAMVDVYPRVVFKRIEETNRIKVEAFPPEELLIKRDWTSPLLQDCPYVARVMRVTLSDLHEMGFKDVTADDLNESSDVAGSADKSFRDMRMGGAQEDFVAETDLAAEDESLTEGFLRIEYVLTDFDGDGIAERRCILRLKHKILKNEEDSHVPFATASPILVTHRWDGMSIWEIVADLQQLKTELTRQVMNSAFLANNPRKKVLTDKKWNPMVQIDDVVDSKPGALMRVQSMDALSDDITPFVGGQMGPLLEYIDGMREQRTGVSRRQQGMDANALRNDRSATEARLDSAAAKTRVKLIARIFAELLVKPIFQGILKLLTEGDMDKIAFQLRNEFVEYDPNEWRDGYDMTINVGLGTGDRDLQAALLQGIAGSQMALAQSPFGPLLVSAKKIYNTQAKLVENAGFKNVGEFWNDPGDGPPPPMPAPPPHPSIITTQMELTADAQKFQAEQAAAERQRQVDAELQAATDRNRQEYEARQKDREQERDAQLDAFKAVLQQEADARDRAFKEWQTEIESLTRIVVAQVGTPDPGDEQATMATLQGALQGLNEQMAQMKAWMTAPRRIVKDQTTGRPVGVEIEGFGVRPAQMDESGRIAGM